MRILFINTFSDPIILGGAERTLRIIVEGMRARGHDVHVVSLRSDIPTAGTEKPDHTENYPSRNIYAPDGQKAHSFVQKILWHGIDLYNPVAAGDLAREFEAFQPDLVSCHNLSGWSIAAWDVARRNGVPIIQVLHDYYLMCISGMRARGGVSCDATCLRCKVFRLLHKRKSRAVSAVVGISDHILKQYMNDGFFEGVQSTRIYNVATPIGIEPAYLDYPETQTFGFIGRIAPHKGIETALKAFSTAALPKNSTFLIAGDGEPSYVAHLKDRFSSKRVQFLGTQKPDNFFRRLSWTIVPSISDEPLGRVVFESHGYGVPVLGSRRGGIPEMIKEGQNGYLFDAGQEDDLRRLMEYVSRGAEIQSRASIVKDSAAFFDTGGFLDQYETLYSTFLNWN